MTETEPNANAYPSSKAKGARSVPPVIDLEAQEVKSESSGSDEGKAASIGSAKPFNLQWAGAALLGALVGGALVVGTIAFLPVKDSATDRLTALESAIGQFGSQASIKLLEARLAKAESIASDLRKAVEQPSKPSPELTLRLNRIEEALGHITLQASSSDSALSRSALRLTLAMLIKEKVANSVPFEADYKAFTALAGPSNGNEILQKFSASGSISYEALRSEFIKIVSTPKPMKDTTQTSTIPLSDRVLTMLSHIVTITPTDQIGPESKANFTEIDAALANHQGSQAFERWQSLPDNEKQALAQWASRLREKLDVEMAADALTHDALRSLDIKGADQ